MTKEDWKKIGHFLRFVLVFPTAFVGLIAGFMVVGIFPPMGPQVMDGSDQVPLYSLYLASFTSVFFCLGFGSLMAPSRRVWTVALGIFMLIACGAPFDFAFWQYHADLTPEVSRMVYVFNSAACIIALLLAWILDRRMKKLTIPKSPDYVA